MRPVRAGPWAVPGQMLEAWLASQLETEYIPLVAREDAPSAAVDMLGTAADTTDVCGTLAWGTGKTFWACKT